MSGGASDSKPLGYSRAGGRGQHLNLIGIVCVTGIQDRDWRRGERRRKRRLYWKERTGEMEFDRPPSRRRLRWPYRLRPELPDRVREWIRAGLFFGVLGLLYLAWTHIRG